MSSGSDLLHLNTPPLWNSARCPCSGWQSSAAWGSGRWESCWLDAAGSPGTWQTKSQARRECRKIYREENKKAEPKIEQKVAEKDKPYLPQTTRFAFTMTAHHLDCDICVDRYSVQYMPCAPVCVEGCNGLRSTCILRPCLLQQDALHQPCDVYVDVAGEALQAGSIGCYSHQQLRRTGYLLGGLVVIGHSHDDPGETVNQRH